MDVVALFKYSACSVQACSRCWSAWAWSDTAYCTTFRPNNAGRLTAKHDTDNDVYALTPDGREILTYAKTLQRHASSDRTLAEIGGALAGLGLLPGLVGWLWNRRSLA